MDKQNLPDRESLTKEILKLFYEITSVLPAVFLLMGILGLEKLITKNQPIDKWWTGLSHENGNGLLKIVSFVIYVVIIIFIATYGMTAESL